MHYPRPTTIFAISLFIFKLYFHWQCSFSRVWLLLHIYLNYLNYIDWAKSSCSLYKSHLLTNSLVNLCWKCGLQKDTWNSLLGFKPAQSWLENQWSTCWPLLHHCYTQRQYILYYFIWCSMILNVICVYNLWFGH